MEGQKRPAGATWPDKNSLRFLTRVPSWMQSNSIHQLPLQPFFYAKEPTSDKRIEAVNESEVGDSSLDSLADVLRSVLQQPIDSLRQFPRRGHDSLGRTGTGLNASVERTQRMFSLIASLDRQTQGATCSVPAAEHAPAADLSRRSLMLGAQA